MPDDPIPIDQDTAIPLSELSFRYARSSGPGGQHVQRSETKVELLFDLAHSPSLTDSQRQRAMNRLSNRLDSDGVLHLTSQAGRSQHENREDVIQRFQMLLAGGLKPRKRRKPTRPSKAAKERRLDTKRRRSLKKRLRGRVEPGQ